MSKKPGVILRLPDERLVIVYNEQPLLVSRGYIILHLVDKDYNLIEDDGKHPLTLLRSVDQYNLENESGANKLIGHVD